MMLHIIKRIFFWLFHNPTVFLDNVLCNTAFLYPDKLFIKLHFRLSLGYWPDLNNPKTFNEKINWLKFNDIHPEYSMMVDKYEVKKYVASKIGDEYIIPTIGLWNTIDEITWSALPNKFVIKSTSDSGSIVICKDISHFNVEEAKNKLKHLGQRDYYRVSKEYPYKNIKYRFIAEDYIEDESGYELKDYKIFCFNGEPRIIEVDFDRFTDHHRNVYDVEWNLLDLQIKFPYNHNRIFDKPKNLNDMLRIAKCLSEGIPHVRVDLYNIGGKIFFGELTFFHGSGLEHFTPHKWEYILGEMIKLPTS